MSQLPISNDNSNINLVKSKQKEEGVDVIRHTFC